LASGVPMDIGVDRLSALVLVPGILSGYRVKYPGALILLQRSMDLQHLGQNREHHRFAVPVDHALSMYRELAELYGQSLSPDSESMVPHWALATVLEGGVSGLHDLRAFGHSLSHDRKAMGQKRHFDLWLRDRVTSKQLQDARNFLLTCRDESFRKLVGHHLALELWMGDRRPGLVAKMLASAGKLPPLRTLKTHPIEVCRRTRSQGKPIQKFHRLQAILSRVTPMFSCSSQKTTEQATALLVQMDDRSRNLQHAATSKKQGLWHQALSLSFQGELFHPKPLNKDEIVMFANDFGSSLLLIASLERTLGGLTGEGLAWMLLSDRHGFERLRSFVEMASEGVDIRSRVMEYLHDRVRDKVDAGLRRLWPEGQEPSFLLQSALTENRVWKGIARRVAGPSRRTALIERVVTQVIGYILVMTTPVQSPAQEEGTISLELVPSRSSLDLAYGAMAEVCIAEDTDEIFRPDFIALRIIDREEQQWCGSIFTLVSTLRCRPALVLCGIEPSSALMDRLDDGDFLERVLEAVASMASEIGCEVLAQTTNSTAWSNRRSLSMSILKMVLAKPPYELDRILKFPEGKYDMTSVVKVKALFPENPFDRSFLEARRQTTPALLPPASPY